MRFPILFLCFIAFLSASAQQPEVRKPRDFARSISEGSPLLLDVRTAKEFQAGHLTNAMQANWNDSAEFRERVKHIDRQQPIYVYCLAGSRSAAAATWMKAHGFSRVIELEGGINAWKAAGQQVQNPASVKEITFAEFTARIPANKTVLVDIGADWCPPCRKMKPVIDSVISESQGQVELLTVDAGEQTALLQHFHVTSLPVFIIYRNGKEAWRGEGIIAGQDLKKQLY